MVAYEKSTGARSVLSNGLSAALFKLCPAFEDEAGWLSRSKLVNETAMPGIFCRDQGNVPGTAVGSAMFRVLSVRFGPHVPGTGLTLCPAFEDEAGWLSRSKLVNETAMPGIFCRDQGNVPGTAVGSAMFRVLSVRFGPHVPGTVLPGSVRKVNSFFLIDSL